MISVPHFQALLLQLQYSRRFCECCFLLKKKANLKKTQPISDFWSNREIHYLKWNEVPQVKSILDDSIIKICEICDLEYNREHALLIFTCAHYGVWHTTRWLIRNQKKQGVTKSDKEYDLALVTAFTVIRYLASELERDKRLYKVDHITYEYIEKVTDWLRENDWGNFHMEKPDKEDNKELRKFNMDLVETLPIQVRYLIEQLNQKNRPRGKIRRIREFRRNYMLWRWREQGLTRSKIADRWNDVGVVGKYEPISEDVVAVSINNYKKVYGPIFKGKSITGLYTDLLSKYDSQDAAGLLLSQAYERHIGEMEVQFPPQDEVSIE